VRLRIALPEVDLTDDVVITADFMEMPAEEEVARLSPVGFHAVEIDDL